MKSAWHYPRTAFAEEIYGMLIDGPYHAVRMFGPRRTGKTQFLLRDLGPLAEARGHRVAYASLWQNQGAPLGTLLYQLRAALGAKTFVERFSGRANTVDIRFKLKIPLIGDGEIAVDLGEANGTPPPEQLLALEYYCGRLANARRPAFLLFDEVQQLAKAPGGVDIVAALRTALDTRTNALVSVFTGSSQDELRRMFSNRDAPFFRFAEQRDLPMLGSAFVHHQLAMQSTVSRRVIDQATAAEMFSRLECNPGYFRKWMDRMSSLPDATSEQAFEAIQDEIAEEFGYRQRWIRMSTLHRAMARLVAENEPDPFGKAGAERLTKLSRAPAPSPQKRQTAMKYLERHDIVLKGELGYLLPDPIFAAWIRARPTREF